MAWFVVVAVAALCSAITSVTSYVLVARFALLERITTAVLRRGLRSLSVTPRDASGAYSVTRTDAGKFILPKEQLRSFQLHKRAWGANLSRIGQLIRWTFCLTSQTCPGFSAPLKCCRCRAVQGCQAADQPVVAAGAAQ